MKKNLFFVILFFVTMALSASNIWAEDISAEAGVDFNADLNQQQEMSQTQEQKANAAASGAAASESRVNYKSVIYPEVGAVTLNPPETPLSAELLLNQWNEAGFNEIFCSFPRTMTEEMIQTVIAEKEKADRKFSYKKMTRDIYTDPMIFSRERETKKVIPVLGINPCFKEGVDYKIIARLVYVAEDKKISRDWIALKASYDAMNYGGDLMMPTGEGSERVFKNKASLLSFLGAVANAGGNTAYNVAPGIGIGGGENSVKVFPYMRVKVIKILNWDKFADPDRFCQECKEEEIQIITSSKTCNSEQFQIRIKQLKEATKHCPNNCLNNALLWKQIGDTNVEWYLCSKDKKLLDDAIYAYKRSEKNVLTGHEPDGTSTRDLTGAQEILKKDHWNQAAVIRELNGRKAEISFVSEKRMTGEMPTNLNEIRK